MLDCLKSILITPLMAFRPNLYLVENSDTGHYFRVNDDVTSTLRPCQAAG